MQTFITVAVYGMSRNISYATINTRYISEIFWNVLRDDNKNMCVQIFLENGDKWDVDYLDILSQKAFDTISGGTDNWLQFLNEYQLSALITMRKAQLKS